MNTYELSMRVPAAGDTSGQSVSASTASAATTNLIGAVSALVYSTVECFAVKGTALTATVASGIPIPAVSRHLRPQSAEPKHRSSWPVEQLGAVK